MSRPTNSRATLPDYDEQGQPLIYLIDDLRIFCAKCANAAPPGQIVAADVNTTNLELYCDGCGGYLMMAGGPTEPPTAPLPKLTTPAMRQAYTRYHRACLETDRTAIENSPKPESEEAWSERIAALGAFYGTIGHLEKADQLRVKFHLADECKGLARAADAP